MQHWEILFFFFVISFVYASVGFGGGSSYLAVLAVYALPFKEIRLIALICNIIVVSSGTLIFAFRNYVDWKKILPLVVASVPMAFLGAKITVFSRTPSRMGIITSRLEKSRVSAVCAYKEEPAKKQNPKKYQENVILIFLMWIVKLQIKSWIIHLSSWLLGLGVLIGCS